MFKEVKKYSEEWRKWCQEMGRDTRHYGDTTQFGAMLGSLEQWGDDNQTLEHTMRALRGCKNCKNQ